MNAIRVKIADMLPVRVKNGLRDAIHPAQRIALQRLAGKRVKNLGVLTVVVPVHNVEQFLPACLDSIIAQSYTNLEIIVVDDGSTDSSVRIAREYARWDKRISVMELKHGGNGRARNLAIASSTGEFLTFADSDDVVTRNAYSYMMQKISASGSDFVVGSSDRLIGKKRELTKMSSRLHAQERVGINVSDFPEIFDDVFLWNKLFTRIFWDANVGPIPEDILYEDQETTARAFIRAASFDVLTDVVYSWRQRPGSGSITQGKGELQNLKDRLTVADQVSSLVLTEGNSAVAQVWYKRLFGSDLIPYFDLVANRGDDYWEALSSTVKSLSARFESSEVITARTLESIDPHARVFQELARFGLRDQVEDVIIDRIDSSKGFEVQVENGHFIAIPNYWGRLEHTKSMQPLVCTPEALTYESAIRVRDYQDGRGPFLEGYAYIRGLDLSGIEPMVACQFELPDGTLLHESVDCRDDWRVDVESNDVFAPHSSSGFELQLLNRPELLDAEEVHIEIDVNGVVFHSQRKVNHAKHSIVKAGHPKVVHVDVDHERESISLTVDWGQTPSSQNIYLSTAQTKISPTVLAEVEKKSIRYTFDLPHLHWGKSVYSYPSGSYTLRYGRADAGAVSPIGSTANLKLGAPFDYSFRHSNVTAWVTGAGNFAVTIAAPLSIHERSKNFQRKIQNSFLSVDEIEVKSHIVIECFSGTLCTDSPLALAEEIKRRNPLKMIYCSVVDYSVVIPDYVTPLIRGSELWVSIVQSAELLINNDVFAHYFKKNPKQYYLQTWHGTPIKKVGFDTPTKNISCSYRNRILEESVAWSALLSQNEYSTDIFRSAFRYIGDIFCVGYPRNDSLTVKESDRKGIRETLGISDDTFTVLFAPTWRDEEYNSKNGEVSERIDLESLLHQNPSELVVLARSHHNVLPRAKSNFNGRVIDVSDYPQINELILASDCLVSDYSSIVFDYIVTGKPVLGYIPDKERYKNVRGVYMDPGEIYGTKAALNISDLSSKLKSVEKNRNKSSVYANPIELMAPNDDGQSSARIVDLIHEKMRLN